MSLPAERNVIMPIEISPTITLPSPAAVPEGAWFRIFDDVKVEIPRPLDVVDGGVLYTCLWERQGDKYVMVMRKKQDGTRPDKGK